MKKMIGGMKTTKPTKDELVFCHNKTYVVNWIWHQLFQIYQDQGGSLKNMGDMLIDYKTLDDTFKAGNTYVWGVEGDLTSLRLVHTEYCQTTSIIAHELSSFYDKIVVVTVSSKDGAYHVTIERLR